MMKDLLQSVKRDRYVLQSTRLPEEEQDGVTARHAPQLLMHFGPVADEVVHATLSYNLRTGQGGHTRDQNLKI